MGAYATSVAKGGMCTCGASESERELAFRELDEYLLVAVILSVLSFSKGEGCQQLQGLDMTDAIVETITCNVRRTTETTRGNANSG